LGDFNSPWCFALPLWKPCNTAGDH